jgi:hypothetical protein
MATVSRDSDVQIDAPKLASGEIWLNGDVLACACPECRAPMSIRLWLMLADCWRCGTSIELTEEQQRQARQLLEQRGGPQNRADKPARQPSAPAVDARQKAAAPAPTAHPVAPALTRPVRKPPRRAIGPPVAAPPVFFAPAQLVRDWLRDLPAWLASLIVNLLLLILLSLFSIRERTPPPTLTLLTHMVATTRDGGDSRKFDETAEIKFDLPLGPARDARRREVLLKADRDARQLRLDPEAERWLPELTKVRASLNNNDRDRRMLVARDPRLRAEIVDREGGTIWTEAAVARGLFWLARHQNEDGSWDTNRFGSSGDCGDRCRHNGSGGGKMAGTSLALLPFLGAGQSPHVPCKYRDVVSRGLGWLLANQHPVTGDLRGDTRGNGEMYVHGQATIVLCEAFALTGDEALRQPAQKAVHFIDAAQHPEGGWRYRPLERGDTSVIGWQVMALYSAKAAGLEVSDATLKLAGYYLDAAESRVWPGRYGYQPGQPPRPSMTAEALLCRLYLGGQRDDAGLESGVMHLLADHPADARQADIYYWYYATQVFHHWGGQAWKRWNLAMQTALVSLQETSGHEAGSFSPRTRHDYTGGRLYATALAVCTLEVYYRHTPIFRRIDLR